MRSAHGSRRGRTAWWADLYRSPLFSWTHQGTQFAKVERAFPPRGEAPPPYFHLRYGGGTMSPAQPPPPGEPPGLPQSPRPPEAPPPRPPDVVPPQPGRPAEQPVAPMPGAPPVQQPPEPPPP